MADKDKVKATAEKTGLPEDYVNDMLDFQERYEARKKEVAPLANALGMTPEKYISKQDQHQLNLQFVASKGFDVKAQSGLEEALAWLKTTDPDNLLYGEPTGDPFDVRMGALRRSMLIETITAEMNKGKAN